MKPSVRNVFLLFFFGLLDCFIPATAQEVIVTVKAFQDTQGVSIDSILVRNETNGQILKLGQLSQSANSYMVNLNTGVIDQTTEIKKSYNPQAISVTASSSGFVLNTLFELPQKINVRAYALDGKCLTQKNEIAPAGVNSYPYSFVPPSNYVVHLNSGQQSYKIKVVTPRTGSTITTWPCTEKLATTKSATVSGFGYTAGDRIQVVVKKGNITSPAWLGKPVNGDQVLVALPKTGASFNMTQTLSLGAQINTIAFSGVAFYSGCFYASSFYPPGKVADYFGFQYMRDNDPDESGHNTDFLTKAAYHMMHILDASQMQVLIDLAVEQEPLFNQYALGRLTLIKAFHRYLSNDMPAGTTSLNQDSVIKLSRNLYLIDAEISYGRSIKFAQVIRSLTEAQRDTLYKLGALGMMMWPMPDKPTVTIPRGMNTWVMSNASELFSWFLRGVEADIYFCPERQGTYYGGFYMKDAPAVGTPGYAIDPQATANKGAYMLNTILTANQSKEIKNIYTMVKPSLDNMVVVRTSISNELRKAIAGETVNKADIQAWSALYGEYDGVYNFSMVEQFVKVGRTLTTDQLNQLVVLRDLADYPCQPGKAFLFSTEVTEPAIPNTDFLFK